MKHFEKIIDCSAWSGNWAFLHLKYGKLNLLQEKLSKYNIIRAYVSPIEGILEEDPMRANNELCSLIDNIGIEFFSPVPIIDLSFANWDEAIELAITRDDVKIVKLLPNYHMYELSEDVLEGLVDYTQKHNLLISIQMRVEDARGQYPLMKVPDMDIDEVIKILSSFPEQKFIMNNGNLSEVEQALYFADNIYVDISSVESQDVVTYLGGKYGLDRILFSTHSAFFYLEGNVFKLAYSGLGREGLDKVAYGNAEKLGL